MSRSGGLFRKSTALISSLSLMMLPFEGPVAFAQSVLPQGGSVVGGSATISQPSASALSITQSSARAIINWNSFSVGQPNSVNFYQPDSSSAALNRVTGSTTSTIAGQLTANGQIFLVNPNGIAITPTGTVVVGGGFVASTLDIANPDFMAGNLVFRGNGASGRVSNQGTITTGPGGFVGLFGGSVSNEGTITVPLGKVGLGSGEMATLDLNGDGFMQVAVPTNATTSNGKSLVDVAGAISAVGGKIQLAVATVAQAIRDAVNVSGSLNATSMAGRNGSVVLGGGPGGNVKVSGNVDVSGTESAGTISADGYNVALSNATATAQSLQGTGGAIIITAANNVALSGATLDASGATGGGLVRIGGDFHGLGAIGTAATTVVDATTSIKADALLNGAGGTVVLWSGQLTSFQGQISAKGGAQGGDGGSVEVSSKGVLDYRGLTDLSAVNGQTGTLLLDPFDLDISDKVDKALFVSCDSSTCTYISTNSGSSNLNTTTLAAALLSANVIAETGSSSGSPSGGGNITVIDPITWTSTNTLTLYALNNIAINASVTGLTGSLVLSAQGTITQNSGTIVQVATLSGSSVGGASLTGANQVTTLGPFSNATSGALTFNNNQDLAISGIVSSAGAVTITAAGNLTLAAGAQVASTQISGNSLVLSATGNFINNSGSTAASVAGAARWLVYSNAPGTDTFDNLNSNNTAIWGNTYVTLPPVSVALTGNRYIFAQTPVITFTSTDASKTYGDVANISSNYTVSGYQTGVANAFLGDTSAYSGAPSLTSDGTAATASVLGGPYPINIARGDLTSSSGYGFAFNSAGHLTVNKADLTITALDRSKTYGDTLTFGNVQGTDFSVSGLKPVNGDAVNTVTLASVGAVNTATYTTPGPTYAITAGSAGGSGLGNYSISYSPGTLTISQAALMVTALDRGKTYGDTLTFGNVNGTDFSVSGLKNSDAVTSVALASAGAAATATYTAPGPTYAITAGSAGGSGLGNYSISYSPGTLTINPRSITITANSGQSKEYGSSDPTLTYTVGGRGLANGESLSGLLGRAAGENIGNYAITPGAVTNSNNPNYSITSFIGANFAINGVTLIGFAYSDRGVTALSGATVTDVINGTSSTAVTAPNGSYTIQLPTTALSNSQVLVYSTGASSGATFQQNVTGSLANFNIYGTYLRQTSAASTLSSVSAALSTAIGSNTSAQNVVNSLANREINATGASFTIDQAINIGGALIVSGAGTLNATAAINVGAFTLKNGAWTQVATTLPNFSAIDFNISGGSFLRALGGSGTGGSPYQIADVYGLQGIGTLPLSNNYVLANNIDAAGTANWNSGAGFVPIGHGNSAWVVGGLPPLETPFTGTFNGQSHTISSLVINRPTSDYIGLFGYISGATVENVVLSNASVTGHDYVGALVGFNDGTVMAASGNGLIVIGHDFVGGLVGVNDPGIVTNSFASGAVSGQDNVGGLVGYNDGGSKVTLSSFAGGTVTGNSNVGGLVGFNAGDISGSSFSNVTVNGASFNAPGSPSGTTSTANTVFVTGSIRGSDNSLSTSDDSSEDSDSNDQSPNKKKKAKKCSGDAIASQVSKNGTAVIFGGKGASCT